MWMTGDPRRRVKPDEDHGLSTSHQREVSFLRPTGARGLGGKRGNSKTDTTADALLPRKIARKIPEFPDSAYRLGQSVGVEAHFPAKCGENQIKFSWSYFRVGKAVNKLGNQSTDSLSRPLFEAEGHQGGRHPRCPGSM